MPRKFQHAVTIQSLTTLRSMVDENRQIEIRVASESDAMMLARFRYEFRSSFHQVLEDSGPFVERCSSWMKDRLRSGGSWRCWIAEWEGTLVGNVWAQLIEKIPNPIAKPEHYVYVTNFYVREEFRSGGIGGRLLAEVLAWSKSNNAETIILWPTERSRAFYLRHGFSTADKLLLQDLRDDED